MSPYPINLSAGARAELTDTEAFATIQSGAHEAATSPWNQRRPPTKAEAASGDYATGPVRWQGLSIRIENPADTIREGSDPDGTPWRNRMRAHYGYIEGTRGADGDEVDIFLGPVPEVRRVWVLNQRAADGSFDEHKVLAGFVDEQHAVNAYRFSYSPGWSRYGPPIQLSLDQLRWWLAFADTTRELTFDLVPPEPEMTDDTELIAPNPLSRVFWDSAAEPTSGKTIAQVLYAIRLNDGADGLVMDPMTMGDITEGADILFLDALVTVAGKLKPKMEAMMRVMEAAGGEVKPLAMQLSEPMRRHGGVHVAALFELSDGQTITVWFHNPDTTPTKITPADDLVSWKWQLNKKDITIVVAPESGQDLNVREVARRLMRLAAKNSPAFARANARRSAVMAEIAGLRTTLDERKATLKSLMSQIEVAKVERESRPAPKLEPEPAPEPVKPAAVTPIARAVVEAYPFKDASDEARALLTVGAQNPAGTSAYATAVAMEKAADGLGLNIRWDAQVSLPAEEVFVADSAGSTLDRVGPDGNQTVNVFVEGDKVVSLDKNTDHTVTHQIGYRVFLKGEREPVHANRLKLASGKKPPRIMLDGAHGDATEEEDDEDDNFDAEAEFNAAPEDDDEPVLDGDFKGHPFRGNQHRKAGRESGAAVGASIKAKRAEKGGDKKAATSAHRGAHHAHMAALEGAKGKAKTYHKKMAKFHGQRAGVKLDAVLDEAEGAYLGKEKRAIAATASLLRYLREFIRSESKLAKNPMHDGFVGKFGFASDPVINKQQAQEMLTKLVDVAVSRKGGEADLTPEQSRRLSDFQFDARIISEYFDKRMHRNERSRNQLRTPEMKKLYPEIDNPGDFMHYAIRGRGRALDDASGGLFGDGDSGYIRGDITAGGKALATVHLREDGMVMFKVADRIATNTGASGSDVETLREQIDTGWRDDWQWVMQELQLAHESGFSDDRVDPETYAPSRKKLIGLALQELGYSMTDNWVAMKRDGETLLKIELQDENPDRVVSMLLVKLQAGVTVDSDEIGDIADRTPEEAARIADETVRGFKEAPAESADLAFIRDVNRGAHDGKDLGELLTMIEAAVKGLEAAGALGGEVDNEASAAITRWVTLDEKANG